MSKLVVTFTFTDSVEVDLANYVDLNMPDSRVIEIARQELAATYDGAPNPGITGGAYLLLTYDGAPNPRMTGGAYLLLGDAGVDIDLADIQII